MNLDTTIVCRGWLKSNLNLEKLGVAELFDFILTSRLAAVMWGCTLGCVSTL